MQHTTDADLVTNCLAGSREAFAAIYDRYADQLFTTASSMLSDRDEAADVVQDVFVTAATKLGQLREPSRLRAWLFAILRNEVYRRSRQRRRAVPTDFTAPGLDVAAPDPNEALTDDMAGADLAALVQEAAKGLDERDQLVLELSVRQGLQGADLAAALGVSAQQGYGLVHRMRERAERSLTAYCVARAGRRDCADLDQLLASWDGEFGVLIRKRVARHIDRCTTCERSKARLAPIPVFGAAPVLAAPIALRDHVLGAVDAALGPDAWSDTSGGGSGGGDPAVGSVRWTRPQADRHGFPRNARRTARVAATAAASLALIAVVALLTAVLVTGAPADQAHSGADLVGGASAADDDVDTIAGNTPPDEDDVESDDAASTEPPGDDEHASSLEVADDADADLVEAPSPETTATAVSGAPPTTAPPPPQATAPATTIADPAPDDTVAPTTPETIPPASTVAPTTSAPPPPTTTTLPPAPGAISITTSSIDFGLADTQRQLQLTNTGGTAVSYSIASPTGFSASPSSGQLAPGATASVTVAVTRAALPEGPTVASSTVSGSGLDPLTVALRADVRRAPTIAGITAPSGTVCTGSVPTPVSVSATITDESAVTGTLSWTGPSGQTGQATMSGSPATASFALEGSPSETTGTWTWLLTATDAWGAVATATGTFAAALC